MHTLFSVLIFIVSILLILIVLVQNSKGGGLAANFTGSTQMMGVRQTADFLEKSTWTLAGVLLGLSILASITIRRPEVEEQKLKIDEQIENAVEPGRVPEFPTAPAEEQPAFPEPE